MLGADDYYKIIWMQTGYKFNVDELSLNKFLYMWTFLS